tara:strand:+ start:841 stop:1083 length:243 start_codon:yes stop_codon:yes gene_type:complete
MPDIIVMLYIFSFLGCILGVLSVCLSLYAVILAKSLEKATHTVQFMPAEQTLDPNFSNQKEIEEINTESKDENDEIYRMV